MKQHFLPKCYLDEFTNADGNIFRLDYFLYKAGRNVYPASKTTSQVCYDFDIYTLNKTISTEFESYREKNKYYIEQDIFWKYENKYLYLIRKVEKLGRLTQSETKLFLRFLVSIKTRNPYILNSDSGENQSLNDAFNEFSIEFLSGQFEGYANLTTEHKQSVLTKLEKHTNKSTEFKKNADLMAIIWRETEPNSILDRIVEKLILYEWAIVNTTLNLAFITTDNPGFCYDAKNIVHNTKFSEGLFVFPLTPEHCLIISDKTFDVQFYLNPTNKHFFNCELDEATLIKFVNSTNCKSLANINKLIISNSACTITKLLQDFIPVKN